MTEKVLFAKTSNGSPKAIGIQISSSRSSQRFAVAASNEVILCAGAVGSPQILQLSGIGDSAHLAEQGIPLVSNLPAVGRNMLDVRLHHTLLVNIAKSCCVTTILSMYRLAH